MWANAKSQGVAYWPGEYNQNQRLFLSSPSASTPQTQDPVLYLLPNGSNVTIPISTWYEYATQSGDIFFTDAFTTSTNTLRSINDDLYWNNVLVATSSNISSIGDWAFYPQVTTLNGNNQDIVATRVHYASSFVGSSMFTTLLSSQTIRTNSFSSSTGFISSLRTTVLNASTINADFFSTILTSSISAPVGFVSTLQTSAILNSTIATHDVLLYDSNVGILNKNGSDLQWNSTTVLTSANLSTFTNVANWAKFPANSNVYIPPPFSLGAGSNMIFNTDATLWNCTSFLDMTIDRGIDPTGTGRFKVETFGGQYGEISFIANPNNPAYTDQGGLINIQANSAPGLTPLALSRVNIEAATSVISAGALGSLAFVPGSVNILSGLGTGIQLLTGTGVINIASGVNTNIAAGTVLTFNAPSGVQVVNGDFVTNTLGAYTGSEIDVDADLAFQVGYGLRSDFSIPISTTSIQAQEALITCKNIIANGFVETKLLDLRDSANNPRGTLFGDLAGHVNMALGPYYTSSMFISTVNITGGGTIGYGGINKLKLTTDVDVDNNLQVGGSISVPIGTFSNIITSSINTSSISIVGGSQISNGGINKMRISTDLDVDNNFKSYSVTATNANIQNIIASTIITSSITFPHYLCSVYSSTSQTVVGANVSTPITFTTTDINVNNFVVGTSTIQVPVDGIYELTLSYQFATTSGGTRQAQFWATQNGNAIPQTNSIVSIVNNGDTLGNISLMVNASAGDHFGSMFYSGDANMTATATPAGTTPGIPSIIASMKKID